MRIPLLLLDTTLKAIVSCRLIGSHAAHCYHQLGWLWRRGARTDGESIWVAEADGAGGKHETLINRPTSDWQKPGSGSHYTH